MSIAHGPAVPAAATCGRSATREHSVKTLFYIVVWCLLFVVCWPLALLAVALWPLLWLLSLPFRLVSITFEAVFALLKAVLLLPARLLGYRDGTAGRTP
jgi:hypothetical protein